MISHRFDYYSPRTLPDALRVLDASGDDGAVLGGGTWLVPNMTYGTHQPTAVVDARHLGLDTIKDAGADISVGARATYRQIIMSPLVRVHTPLLAQMANGITGGVSIVGQGTVGGSACYANPSSDAPASLFALRARLRLESTQGVREVAASDFHVGAFETARRPNEMVTAILIPKAKAGASCGYHKLKFSTGSWPIVTAAVVVEPDANGRRYRIALGAASPTPVLTEERIDADASTDALRALSRRACEPLADEWVDELAGPGYRRSVAPSVVFRALMQCGATQ